MLNFARTLMANYTIVVYATVSKTINKMKILLTSKKTMDNILAIITNDLIL